MTQGLEFARCLLACSALASADTPTPISGIYPHLAVFNQPDDVEDRPNHGEVGLGAAAVWAGKLWYLTYPQHKTTGSNDKLYELGSDLQVTIRPESVGGTHASRMIHRESNQLIIGPYFIDAAGHVRAADLHQLRGRLTAVMRHLTDPANKVYFFDMEGAIYEVDVHSLAVTQLFTKPVPGWHGKGGYTAQGRVVIANNGESDAKPETYVKHLQVGAPPVGEEAGILAEWDGETWRIIERKQFLDITGPGGIHGSPAADSPLWAIGWDHRSCLLKLLDGGVWRTFRLPKGSHTFDPRHGWYTEWPRIREALPDQWFMILHATVFDFPRGFRAGWTGGIRPVVTHLRYIPDFTSFNGRIVLTADDASMMGNPLCGQASSNLWFGTRADLERFGPRSGWGGVWRHDAVRSGVPSDPFLVGGYARRIVHLAQAERGDTTFTIELDCAGRDQWTTWRSVTVPGHGYRWIVLPEDLEAEWLRVKTDRDTTATAYLQMATPRRTEDGEAAIFDGLAEVGAPGGYVAGLIRPAEHNRSLQWLATAVAADGQAGAPVYREVDLDAAGRLVVNTPAESRAAEVAQVAKVKEDWTVDAASVVVTDRQGRRFRLPKGPDAFDAQPVSGRLRGLREAVSERFLANVHGTFYEVPRDGITNLPDYSRLKPVASHRKQIADFCTWRGLLVLSGVRADAPADGHCFGGPGQALWFGTIDDLWRLGRPVGHGGPWLDTPVAAGQESEPYLMTGYDRKRLSLRHHSPGTVHVTVEVDVDHGGFRVYDVFAVPAGQVFEHIFPAGFQAHWVRFTCDQAVNATAELVYD